MELKQVILDRLPENGRDKSKYKNPGIFKLVLDEGGPGFCQFALNNVCNARCGFCNFSLDRLPRDNWQYVERQGALDAIDILHRNSVRYLLFTGGEPMLHPHIDELIQHAADLKMKVMLVTNGGLLKPKRIHEMVNAGLSSFIISVDAANAEAHESNRGLPGVCGKIQEANKIISRLGLASTASVTMSKLVDYEALPDFLHDLGFSAVTFSYPLNSLKSNFLSFSDSDLVDFSREELLQGFEQVKTLKKRFRVVNPTASLEEMQRFVKGEEQRYECYGGFQYFYLDWDLNLWRCHNWETPMCNIYEFDGSQRVRDGCTACMIDCYRDSSVMQHVGVATHDAYQTLRKGHIFASMKTLLNRNTAGSIAAVLEQMPWLLKF